jgi:hypothetical protein
MGLEGTSLPLGKDVTLDIHLTSVAGKGHFVLFHKILFWILAEKVENKNMFSKT